MSEICDLDIFPLGLLQEVRMNGRPCNYWINPMNTFQFGQKITLNENELATRWGISPKTVELHPNLTQGGVRTKSWTTWR
jgi:hypothetical protein